jgi:hypothetical protein
MKSGASDIKIWLWKIWRAKWTFQKVRGYLWNFEWPESFGAKEHGLLRSLGKFSGIFIDF